MGKVKRAVALGFFDGLHVGHAGGGAGRGPYRPDL